VSGPPHHLLSCEGRSKEEVALNRRNRDGPFDEEKDLITNPSSRPIDGMGTGEWGNRSEREVREKKMYLQHRLSQERKSHTGEKV